MDEALYYNALAVWSRGVREALVRIKGASKSWAEAYENVRPGPRGAPDPAHEWERMERRGIRLVLQEDPGYPASLKEIPNPPLGLYIRGPIPSGGHILAIVGTRKSTHDGQAIAKGFSRSVTGAGFIAVSGLATGIDAAAHEGALDVPGPTLAVLGSGLERPYPQRNEWLARRIVEEGGALISEYPLDERPYPYRFLERNRIVSGLAKGVLVVEAPEGSGSLATARHAFEQNRDVFVVPGSVHHPNYKGSHALIRQGAELVTSPDDIFDAYAVPREEKNAQTERAASNEEKLILKALRDAGGVADVDKLVAMTKLETRIVNRTLTFLLIKSIVGETETGYIMN